MNDDELKLYNANTIIETERKTNAKKILFDWADVKENNVVGDIAKNELKKFSQVTETDKLEKIYDKYDLISYMRTTSTPNDPVVEEAPISNAFEQVVSAQSIQPAAIEQKTLSRPNIKEKRGAKAKLNFRGKLILVCYSIIVLLFGFLVGYNVVKTDQLSAEISNVAEEVTLKENYLSELKQVYSWARRGVQVHAWASENGMQEVAEGNQVEGKIILRETPQITKESNWFDAICDFISNLFKR